MYGKKFILLFLLSLWTALLLSVLVVDIPKRNPLFHFEEKIVPSSSHVECAFELKPDFYLLKIMHKIQVGQTKNVVLNGKVISASEVRRKNGKHTDYFYLSSEQVGKNNLLKINFSSGFPEKIKIRLQNYRHCPVGNGVVVFFRPTLVHLLEFSALRSIYIFLGTCLFFAVVWFIVEKTYRKIATYTILILNVALSAIAINNLLPLSAYVVFIATRYFWFWFILMASLVMLLCAVPNIICRKLPHDTRQKAKRGIILALAALITPLFLLHGMWTQPGLYPIEAFDEAAHTYVEIPMVHKALLDGHILKMNFFNNFGSPLLGDPVCNPFALHAWSYLFFKPHIAMTINKIFLSILTFLVLFFFYRRRNLSFYSSMLTALLTYTTPSFFHFFQHHPHQGVLLYFLVMLLLIDLAYSRPKIINYVLLHISFVIFLLSSGTMGIFLGLPFVLAFSLIITKFNMKIAVKLFFLPLATALVLVHPHILYLIKIAPLTWRSGFSFENVSRYSFLELLKGCTFLTDFTGYHTDYSINYSLVVLVFVILGFLAYRNIRYDLNFILSLILGFVPFLFVIIMLRYRWIQSSIPIIKPVDITRILWFSNVFLMIPLGVMFDKLTRKELSLVSTKYLIYLLSPLLLLIAISVKFEESYIRILTHILSPILILLTYYALLKHNSGKEFAIKLFGASVFVLLLLPRAEVYEALVNSCYNRPENTSYAPVEFVENMEPYYRLSTCQMPSHDEPRYVSPGQQIAKYNIFGSAGRSIIAHGDFRAFLEEHDLVSLGWLRMLYFFKPNPPSQLARFGIRYLVCQSKDSLMVEKLGWQKVLSVKDLVLFENPIRPSPFYYISENQVNFIYNYKFSYDRIEVDIPSVDYNNLEVVATFISWPGWKATLDGKPVDLFTGEDKFMRVKVSSSKRLILEFSPYCDLYIIVSAILSFVFMMACCFWGFISNRAGEGSPAERPSIEACKGNQEV